MKKDYTKFSESSNKKEEITTEPILNEEISDKTTEPIIDDTTEETKETAVSIQNNDIKSEQNDVDEVVNNDDTAEDTPLLIANVTGCEKLNVRKGPSKDAEILSIIDEDTFVMVDIQNSVEDFYKVIVDCNNIMIEGYCMKQFINIK